MAALSAGLYFYVAVELKDHRTVVIIPLCQH